MPILEKPEDAQATSDTVDSAQREASRRKVINRLKRIEGQVRGVQRMVEEERSCHDVLTLLSGVRRALDAAGDEVLATYLHDCQADIGTGSVDSAAIIEAVKLARG